MDIMAKLAEPLVAWLGPGLAGLVLLAIAVWKSNYSQTAQEFNQILEQRKQLGIEATARVIELTKENEKQRDRIELLEKAYSLSFNRLDGMRRYARHILHLARGLFQSYYSAGSLKLPMPQATLPPVPALEDLEDWQAPDAISPQDVLANLKKENGDG